MKRAACSFPSSGFLTITVYYFSFVRKCLMAVRHLDLVHSLLFLRKKLYLALAEIDR